MKQSFFALLLLSSAAFLPAQQSPSSRQSCTLLRRVIIPASAIALPTHGARVTSAKLSHSGSIEFCKLLGEINSIDPAAQPIRFELNLPTQWNGKALHFGGGGFDGALSVTNGLHTEDVGIRTAATPLQRGYSTFGSDSGHHHHYLFLPDIYNELKSSFALNLEERRNYAHDALKKTHDTAVFLIAQRYGASPRRMFFIGGSTGGREAYFVTQLYPLDYDGVLGAYAGWNQVHLDLQFIRISQAEYRAGSSSLAGSKKLTRGWLPTSKTRLVVTRVMQACDALDGFRDGIISNPGACHFSLPSLSCPVGQDHKTCLTPGQLQTLETFNTEQRTAEPLVHGVQTMPGFNITAGTDLTGSLGLLKRPFHPPVYLLNSFHYVVGDGVLRFFLTGNPHFNALTFDTTTGGPYGKELLPQSIASDASDADLSRFAQHGGKFLMLHGTTDATIPTNSSVEFYAMLQAQMGQQALDRFVRFYLIPGFGHGRGVFNAGFDGLGALDRWVETDVPPHDLVVTDNNKAQHSRTRPLCPYPTWPRYISGDPSQSTSFTCSAPTP